MSNTYSKHHHHHSHNSAERNITAVLLFKIAFVVIELVGGVLTNSMSILSDAIHDIGDSVSMAITWFFQRKSKKERTDKFSYGYKRFSLLGSITLAILLFGSSLMIIWESAVRIINPAEVSAKGMLWLALLGIVVNGVAALRVKRGSSINERSVYLHIMADALGWTAILIGSVVMMFVDIPILDPILSIGIAVWVLITISKNIMTTIRVFLQATPDDVDLSELQSKIQKVDGVNSIEDIRVWSLDGESHVMTLHLIARGTDKQSIKKSVLDIASDYRIDYTTLELG